ncbi:hypothetical protein JOF48_002225 [Arthrobacter stackebrandtii]|uniref:Uncharacterized protein n=1 Tax=Arthrobacter stackebrandtii TaxID=272161 RepID=A0ABS4YX80_9MICC|nr:hypothetical protein [Arthrobacter stackebrandtii]
MEWVAVRLRYATRFDPKIEARKSPSDRHNA